MKIKGIGQWVFGGGAVLLFLSLLAIRLDVGGSLFPAGSGPTEGRIQKNIAVGESWMNVTQAGRKIGYTQRSYEKTADGFRFAEHVVMQVNTMGVVQPITIRTTAELGPDGTLLSFRFDLGSNLFQFTARGTVEGKTLTLHAGPKGNEKRSTMTLNDAPYLGGGILETAGLEGLKPGDGRTFPIFDPASLGLRPVRITLMGEEPLVVMGAKHPVRKVSVDFAGMKQTAWIDRDGKVLREEGMLGLVLERVPKEMAMAGIEGALGADLTEIAAVASPKPIEAPQSLNLLRVRLTGLSEAAVSLDGGRQVYREGVLTIRRETRRPAAQGAALKEDLDHFLKPSPFIQSDHPKIKETLSKIVTPADTREAAAEKIIAWVYKNIEKRPVLSVPDALSTLENKVGDCNEHAVLLAALARAAGIPTDMEVGLVYMRGRFYYHAWNILHLGEWGGWVTADSTLGQFPADVTHIRMIRGDADRQLDLVGVIGKVKIVSLETEK